MNKLIDYVQQYASLTRNEISLVTSKVNIETISAKTFILEADQICEKIGFIDNGIVRSYSIDFDGNEIIKCFHTTNQFAVNLSSYQNETVSNDYIQTLTNCKILFISKSSDEYLSNTLDKWPILIRKISDSLMFEKIENRTIYFHKDAKTRYLSFIKDYPGIINQVPLGQIASFLGIAQQSLSRIRKEITH